MTLIQMIKSKTLSFNVIVTAVVGALKLIGYDIPGDVVAGILAIGNFILRFFTKVPLSEK